MPWHNTRRLIADPPEDNRYYAGFFLQPGAIVKPEGEVGLMTIPAGASLCSFTMGLMKPCGKPGTRLTETGYRPAAKLRDNAFEVYLNDKRQAPSEELITEIYIPIE
jgi:DNA gyrase inhibitor GyrI